MPITIPGIESESALAHRVVATMHDAAERVGDGTAVLVTHGGAARVGCALLLGWPVEAWHTLAVLDNCRFADLRRHPTRGWQVHGYNTDLIGTNRTRSRMRNRWPAGSVQSDMAKHRWFALMACLALALPITAACATSAGTDRPNDSASVETDPATGAPSGTASPGNPGGTKAPGEEDPGDMWIPSPRASRRPFAAYLRKESRPTASS